uniref:Uncharacterized protein n=1 Tax=Anguilla anguilla TaxID=7936 RepID=A0A0E9WR58_ANGAN
MPFLSAFFPPPSPTPDPFLDVWKTVHPLSGLTCVHMPTPLHPIPPHPNSVSVKHFDT